MLTDVSFGIIRSSILDLSLWNAFPSLNRHSGTPVRILHAVNKISITILCSIRNK